MAQNYHLVGDLVALDLAKRGRLGELSAYKAANPASKLTWQIAATHLFPHFPLVAKLGLPGFYDNLRRWYEDQFNRQFTWREIEIVDPGAAEEVRHRGESLFKLHFESSEAKWKHWVGWVYAAHTAWARLILIHANKLNVKVISCTQYTIGDESVFRR